MDEGFGLVELVVAMAILNIGLLALLGAFVSGVTTTRHNSRVATASTLADSQLELYRALTYSNILLDTSTIPATAPYTADVAYSATQVTGSCSGAIASNPNCSATQTVTGPDHGTYEIDTYITSTTPANGRTAKQITVVVRDTTALSGPPLVRRTSIIDVSAAS